MAEKSLNELLTEIITKNNEAWAALISDEVIQAAQDAGIIEAGGV